MKGPQCYIARAERVDIGKGEKIKENLPSTYYRDNSSNILFFKNFANRLTRQCAPKDMMSIQIYSKNGNT